MNKLIKVSIVTPTLNNGKDVSKFLKSISKQKFPKSNLEIIFADGGSTDSTLKIAKKNKVKIIKNPYVLADPGVTLGIDVARGELVMVLACDNIFKSPTCLSKMIEIFNNKKIVAAFPLHCSDKNSSIYTKYINQFTDPFNHFIYGYASNGRTFNKVFTTIESNDAYDVYDFKSTKDKPLIAVAQGFTVRKKFVEKRKSKFDDILPVIELIENKNNIAFAHSIKLYHDTVKDATSFMKKQTWATVNAMQKKNYGIAHRIKYLSKRQKIKARIWPFYSFSVIFPFIKSAYHSIKDREPLWLMHPILCLLSAIASLRGLIIYLYDKNYEFKR